MVHSSRLWQHRVVYWNLPDKTERSVAPWLDNTLHRVMCCTETTLQCFAWNFKSAVVQLAAQTHPEALLHMPVAALHARLLLVPQADLSPAHANPKIQTGTAADGVGHSWTVVHDKKSQMQSRLNGEAVHST